MTLTTLSGTSTPGAGSSRHPTIGSRLNTDGPIPPRLRNSPFLAAVSASASSASTPSLPLSSSVNPQISTQSHHAAFEYTPPRNNSDPALTFASSSGSWARLPESQALDPSPLSGLHSQKISPQQARMHRIAHSRAASMGGHITELSSSVAAVGPDGKPVARPPTPIPTPRPAASLPHPQRVRSPLSNVEATSPVHIDIPPTSIASLTGIGATHDHVPGSTPYPYPYNPPSFISATGPAIALDSALDDSSDSEESEEYFESFASFSPEVVYLSTDSPLSSSPPSSFSSASPNGSPSTTEKLEPLAMVYSDSTPPVTIGMASIPARPPVLPAVAGKRVLRPRGQSTPSMGSSRPAEVDLDAYFTVALKLGAAATSVAERRAEAGQPRVNA
ncbi:hypothetical protein DL93DRAFT_433703 [Clavulina sp. PMI_390]|nr:hypothetical protein DL93DRAFT_433703 [Clavulina sp. PMI_390]